MSKSRSIFASPARDARAIARWAWTWRRTRRSSCRTITKDVSARSRRTRSATSTSGRVWLRTPWPGQSGHAASVLGRHREADCGHAAAAQDSRVCSANIPILVPQGQAHNHRRDSGCALARHLQQFLLPDTAKAAVEVLRRRDSRCSYRAASLCCGRPLYDFGMLDRAKRFCCRSWTRFAEEIEAGIPIVVLEPSCAAVFRDELLNLFPRDDGRTSCRSRHFCSVNSWRSVRLISIFRSSNGRRWSTATAITRRRRR